ncbi:MAG: type 4a pilus biogenesis protein PilO [Gammaproteobacteria bacterium]|nr:type 4a pilus biogenesis protein PilO [Gammaproteobacteria bacterium]
MKFSDLNNIDVGDIIDKINNLDANDLKNIGSAPKPVKVAALVAIFLAVLVAGYFLKFTTLNSQIERLKKEEQTLRKSYDQKQATAVNLEAYTQQLEDMRKSFGTLLRQLPDKTEIESLLTDISQTGIAAGLEIEYFKPDKLISKEFYSEYPIKLKVSGRYHQFANFVSGVAALPRIVTLQDITISPQTKTKDNNRDSVKMMMDLTVITYQYLEESSGGKL